MTEHRHEQAKAKKFHGGGRRPASDDGLECPECYGPISLQELAKNHGICDECVQKELRAAEAGLSSEPA